MSSIKLVHSGGNSVTIAAPDSNPGSNRTLKVPSDADGTIITTGSPAPPATGSVIQTLNMSLADGNMSTTTTEATWMVNKQANNTQHKLAITPRFADSKLLINVTGHVQYYVDTSGNAGNIKARLYDETNSSVTHLYGTVVYHYTGGYTRLGGSWGHTILINASNTNARTYRIEYYFDGQQTYYYGSGVDSMTISEIAQ